MENEKIININIDDTSHESNSDSLSTNNIEICKNIEPTDFMTSNLIVTSVGDFTGSDSDSNIILTPSICSDIGKVDTDNTNSETCTSEALMKLENECNKIITDSATFEEKSKNIPNNYEQKRIRKTKEEISSQIVKNYEEGPSENRNAAIANYSSHQVDRYGFIYQKDYSHSSFQKLVNEKPNISRWTEICKNWEVYATRKKKKLRNYVFDGIPDSMRSEVWIKLLNIEEQIKSDPTLYSKLKAIGVSKSAEIDQIDKDIERTLRTHVLYNVRFGQKQQELFNILVAYSVYDEQIRYTQGMNELAAVLLMYMNEEEAFWALKTIITDKIHNIHGFYCDNFPKLIVFQAHLEKTVQLKLPKLYKHLYNVPFDIPLISTKWFLLCFINSLPFQLVLRIWDIFMLEGVTILYPVAYSLIKYHQVELRKSSLDQLSVFFREGTLKYRYSISTFIDQLKENVKELTKEKFYPIPGVEHDIVSIDVSAFYPSSDDLKIKDTQYETVEKSEEEVESSIRYQTLSRRSWINQNNNGQFHHSFNMHSRKYGLFSNNTFDPQVNIPPKPNGSWDVYKNKLQIYLQKENTNIVVKGNIDIEAISKLIKEFSKNSNEYIDPEIGHNIQTHSLT